MPVPSAATQEFFPEIEDNIYNDQEGLGPIQIGANTFMLLFNLLFNSARINDSDTSPRTVSYSFIEIPSLGRNDQPYILVVENARRSRRETPAINEQPNNSERHELSIDAPLNVEVEMDEFLPLRDF